MRSNQKGFTLVELIVVIAIIGVITAILVPSIMGYVKKSRLKTANYNAKNAFTAINDAATDLTCDGKVGNIVKHSPIAVQSLNDSDDLEFAVKSALDHNGINSGYVCWDVSAAKKVICAQWSPTNNGTDIIGQYPNPCDDADAATTTIGNLLNSASWPDATRPDFT